MKSGLEGRNNKTAWKKTHSEKKVSMKSGLEGRNNAVRHGSIEHHTHQVSMKSGLEGRNNMKQDIHYALLNTLSQ